LTGRKIKWILIKPGIGIFIWAVDISPTQMFLAFQKKSPKFSLWGSCGDDETAMAIYPGLLHLTYKALFIGLFGIYY